MVKVTPSKQEEKTLLFSYRSVLFSCSPCHETMPHFRGCHGSSPHLHSFLPSLSANYSPNVAPIRRAMALWLGLLNLDSGHCIPTRTGNGEHFLDFWFFQCFPFDTSRFCAEVLLIFSRIFLWPLVGVRHVSPIDFLYGKRNHFNILTQVFHF